MIVPMKKVSLIIMGDKKAETLKKLRELGIVHIEITEGSGERLGELKDKLSLLEKARFCIEKQKSYEVKKIAFKETLAVAQEIISLGEEKKRLLTESSLLRAELDRLEKIGELDPREFESLSKEGVNISLYECSKAEYGKLDDSLKTIRLKTTKTSVIFLLVKIGDEDQNDNVSISKDYLIELPQLSTLEIRRRIAEINSDIEKSDKKLNLFACYKDSITRAIETVNKELEFETYATGMGDENLSVDSKVQVSVSYFSGYIEAQNLDRLKDIAKKNSWGLMAEEPSEEDNVPTKLKNNRFVSLIYPLTDFLGTVPGYFEYDISGWFLSFILIFFGIIFGDGGYGLFITAIAAIPILKALVTKKTPSAIFLLMGLFGLSTMLWGTLTCTWFGLSCEQLPQWLKSLSVPVISNVYADKLWHPFWTEGNVGLTTGQNLQIFCFLLALIQLTVAHIKVAGRNKKSLKILGDIGAILQLLGMYYLVLSLVVNSEVFSFGLIIGGIPVGTLAIAFIGIGFVLSFVFANYEGSIIKSILSSLTNIVSVLLGVVNVFSDIVSYIRLWAVGLAGAAISATVNELVGPLLGNFMFMLLAIFVLVFGHGLNMILNVLSVIVHGIRLNTLEFSSHLDMSWSGHKFKPFKE